MEDWRWKDMPKAGDSPSAWADITESLGSKGVSALYDYWYGGGLLEDEEYLREVYDMHPIGAQSFKIWVNQRLKQVQRNAIMSSNVLV